MAPPETSTSLVSIVIPSYKPMFFRAALISAFAQRYRSVEVIVSDDCPTGDIAAICAEFPQVAYSRNPTPGHYANFDRCLSLARGDFVKFLLDDDILLPDCIARMVKGYHDCLPDRKPSLIASRYQHIGEDGSVLKVRGLDPAHTWTLFSSQNILRTAMLHTVNAIGALTSVLFPRRSLEHLGENYFTRRAAAGARGLVDFAAYFDLHGQGPFLYCKPPLVQFRINRFQLSRPQNNPNAILTLTAWENLVREAAERGILRPEDMRRATLTIAERYRRWEHIFPELAVQAARLEEGMQDAGAPAEEDLAEPPSAGKAGFQSTPGFSANLDP